MDRFTIDVPQPVLEDLHRRLDATRWPVAPAGAGWRYGIDPDWIREVARHWRHDYDWRAEERRLNALPHWRAQAGGMAVHFILERGSGPAPLPLILTHGWPGSFEEFTEVIGPLAHPERHGGRIEDAFTVVVPSLPGYGFSPATPAPVTPAQIGAAWADLMGRVLGFPRWVAQGGDWGGIVTAQMALAAPEGLMAIHLNIAALHAAVAAQDLTAEESDWQKADAARRAVHAGYRMQQGTKPQTLAYGLTDSPMGLAAWILEKFHGWTVPDSPLPPPFAMNRLLTNVMFYWLGGINAANWLYLSSVAGGRNLAPGARVQVPTGFMLCPDDIGVPPPESWLNRAFNMVHRRDAAQGGHFLAFEQPDLFVQELRTFFAAFR